MLPRSFAQKLVRRATGRTVPRAKRPDATFRRATGRTVPRAKRPDATFKLTSLMTLPVRILAKFRVASSRFARGTVRMLRHVGAIGLFVQSHAECRTPPGISPIVPRIRISPPGYSNDLFGVIKLDGKCEVLTALK